MTNKAQWNTPKPEWLKWKIMKIPSVGGIAEQLQLSYITDGNTNYYIHLKTITGQELLKTEYS